MSCTNCGKINNTCGNTYYSPCIKFEVPEALQECVGAECMTAHESFVDLYERVCSLETETDVSTFVGTCLEVEADSSILEIFQAVETKICALIEETDICNILAQEIVDCSLDYSCLLGADPCGEQVVINTFNDLIQTLINKICTLEEEVAALKLG
jgi:hypothetical protein